MKSLLLLFAASVAQAASIDKVKASDWAKLKKDVQGRLHPGIPLGAACYAKYNGQTNTHVDLPLCAQYEVEQNDASWLATQFGTYLNSNWGMCQSDGQRCVLDDTLPVDPISPLTGNCQQGSISNWYIDVQSEKDIQNGLAFAKDHDIPLVIKSSGHDFKGRSSAPNSLALWLKNFKPGMKLEKRFTPAGCDKPVGDVITYGPGYDFQELNSFAAEHGYSVVSATALSVSPAGGWVQGGGHSPLSVMYGLGVDNVYQLRAVLPNGTFITASRCVNPDLFYALRGGGGGTFGIVTEASQLAHPENGYQFAQFIFPNLDPSQATKFLQICIENAEQWATDGWGGYSFPGMQTNHTSTLFMITPKLSTTEALKSMKPMIDFATDVLQGSVGTATVEPVSSYDIAYTIMAGADDTSYGTGHALASRLVPVENFRGSENQNKLLNAMYPIVNSFGADAKEPLFICMTAPYSYTPDDLVASVSTTPAWRNSLWHVIGINTFSNDASVSEIQQAYATVSNALNPLRALTPGSGAYQNEADTFEPDAAESFWGEENYSRLLSIKKEVDPTNLLTCHGCIGYEEDDSRFGCYPKSPN